MAPSPSPAQPRVVIQLHGINADMTEGGMFIRLAEQLAEKDFEVLRFSFRGHGGSGGTQRSVTIAGELLDLQAAVEYVTERPSGPLSIVASNFGAVSASLSLPWLRERLTRLALWNPVLDLRRTFVEPELPWDKVNYSPGQQELLKSQGFLLVDAEFELGRTMFEEFGRHKSFASLVASDIPTLIVHGDQDTAVSYAFARRAAKAKPGTKFHTVMGSDHGFDTRDREDEAISVTVDWLSGAQR